MTSAAVKVLLRPDWVLLQVIGLYQATRRVPAPGGELHSVHWLFVGVLLCAIREVCEVVQNYSYYPA